ncbi:craniofacial development protein 2, partial [Biomphalaria pfeifferi]
MKMDKGSSGFAHYTSSVSLIPISRLNHSTEYLSWWHPSSKHWHQLDLIMVRQNCLKFVKLTRSYHSADCDTDHSLVC